MIDLGVKPKKDSQSPGGLTCDSSNQDRKNEPCYPSFDIDSSERVDKLKGLFPNLEVGDEVEMTIKVRVSGIQDTKYTKRISFDVLEVESMEEETEEEAAEEKPAKAKTTSPGMSKLMAKKGLKTKPADDAAKEEDDEGETGQAPD